MTHFSIESLTAYLRQDLPIRKRAGWHVRPRRTLLGRGLFVLVGADGAPVIQVLHDFQRLMDDLMARLVVDVGDKTESASVMLVQGSYIPCSTGSP